MSVYYENNIKEKMLSVQLVINASFCGVLQLQDLCCVNIEFVFLCRNYFGKPRESFKIKKSVSIYIPVTSIFAEPRCNALAVYV